MRISDWSSDVCSSDLRTAFPDWWNAPVQSFGDPDAWLAIVGLAPGLQGANRTGRPFTGDRSGPLFYNTLLKVGLATGAFQQRADDGLELNGELIINAVRCVPPQTKTGKASCGERGVQ